MHFKHREAVVGFRKILRSMMATWILCMCVYVCKYKQSTYSFTTIFLTEFFAFLNRRKTLQIQQLNVVVRNSAI